jgi:hypothetical protein
MPTIFYETATATPAKCVAGLTDFGPGPPQLFKISTDNYLEVHSQGPTEADVTERSGGTGEHLRSYCLAPRHGAQTECLTSAVLSPR